MATVTAYTAEHTDEVFGEMIIDGEVSGDDLVLTKQNGDSFTAGNVRGPAGTDAAPGDVNATAGTTPIRASGGRVKGGTATATDDLVPKAQFDSGIATQASAIATHSAQINGVELISTDDLNSYKSIGTWLQSDSSEATLALHYPIASADGILEVFKSSTKTLQRYSPLNNAGAVFYMRTFDGTSWSAWQSYLAKAATMPTPTNTATQSGATTGATELRDSILGNYQFTAIAGHSYRAVVENAALVPDTVSDQFALRIRNSGSSSTPSTSSTLIANSRVITTRTGSAHGASISGWFAPSAGVNTLALFIVRMNGTGTGYVWSAEANRQLYVVDLGT